MMRGLNDGFVAALALFVLKAVEDSIDDTDGIDLWPAFIPLGFIIVYFDEGLVAFIAF